MSIFFTPKFYALFYSNFFFYFYYTLKGVKCFFDIPEKLFFFVIEINIATESL